MPRTFGRGLFITHDMYVSWRCVREGGRAGKLDTRLTQWSATLERARDSKGLIASSRPVPPRMAGGRGEDLFPRKGIFRVALPFSEPWRGLKISEAAWPGHSAGLEENLWPDCLRILLQTGVILKAKL